MLHHLCPHRSQTRSLPQPEAMQPAVPVSDGSRSFLVRRLMPLRCQNHNESNFTAICEQWNRCWPEPPKRSVAERGGIPRSTLGRLVRRTKQLGQIACVPHGSYRGVTQLHPAFAECIRRLFLLPTRLSMTAIREHTEMQQVATRLSKETGTPS